MRNIPEIVRYIDSDTKWRNTFAVKVDDVIIYYSFDMPIAFETPESGKIISKNMGNNVTGRHLNHLDGGGEAQKNRVAYGEFERLWQKYVRDRV